MISWHRGGFDRRRRFCRTAAFHFVPRSELCMPSRVLWFTSTSSAIARYVGGSTFGVGASMSLVHVALQWIHRAVTWRVHRAVLRGDLAGHVDELVTVAGTLRSIAAAQPAVQLAGEEPAPSIASTLPSRPCTETEAILATCQGDVVLRGLAHVVVGTPRHVVHRTVLYNLPPGHRYPDQGEETRGVGVGDAVFARGLLVRGAAPTMAGGYREPASTFALVHVEASARHAARPIELFAQPPSLRTLVFWLCVVGVGCVLSAMASRL